MKHIQFIPKTLGIVLAAILFNQTVVVAQDYAVNNDKVTTTAIANNEQPDIPTEFKLDVAQVEQGQLVFRVTVENPGSDRIILSIRDANNMTLHQESLPATLVYKARFNLQDLQDGNYTFEIRKGKNRLAEKTIGIKTETSINRTVSVQ